MALDPLGVGLAIAALVALAVQTVAVRLSTTEQSVTDVIAVVFAGNVVVLVPLVVLSYSWPFGLTRTSVGAFAVAGVLGSLLARVALFVGIERIGASRAEALKSTFPLVAVAAAVVLVGEAITATLLIGALLLVAGAVAVSWDARAAPDSAAASGRWTDVGYPLAGAVLLGIDPAFLAIGLAEGTPALVGVAVRVLVAAALFAAYLLARGLWTGEQPRVTATRWAIVASLANTTYLTTYLAALGRAPISVVAPILGATPLAVLLLSLVVLRGDERVTARLALAVTVLVAGIVLVLQG